MTSRRESRSPAAAVAELLALMIRLRDRETGCPWDRVQTFATIAPYTIEEAYEVADAIAREDLTALRDELGDLLLQVVFHAEMARELGAFDFGDVARALIDKMRRRHPHVFGDAAETDAAGVKLAWEARKAEERAADPARNDGAGSALDGVALALPALARALKLQSRAARVGFDWPEIGPVLAKVAEELNELRRAVDRGRNPEETAEELGDLLFACVNVARHLGIDAETALGRCNEKFGARFRYIERRLADRGRTPEAASLEEMDALWTEAKRRG